MPISYNSKDAEKAWPESEYPAKLQYVRDTKSKAGKEMQEWTFLVFDDANDRQQTIVEYFVPPAGTFKLRQLAAAVNRVDEFEKGEFQADDHVDASVVVTLGVEKSDQFGDRNKIKRIAAAGAQDAPRSPARPAPRLAMQAANGSDSLKEEDIPF